MIDGVRFPRRGRRGRIAALPRGAFDTSQRLGDRGAERHGRREQSVRGGRSPAGRGGARSGEGRWVGAISRSLGLSFDVSLWEDPSASRLEGARATIATPSTSSRRGAGRRRRARPRIREGAHRGRGCSGALVFPHRRGGKGLTAATIAALPGEPRRVAGLLEAPPGRSPSPRSPSPKRTGGLASGSLGDIAGRGGRSLRPVLARRLGAAGRGGRRRRLGDAAFAEAVAQAAQELSLPPPGHVRHRRPARRSP